MNILPTTDSFVTYEQALALRELGYNEKGYFFFSLSFCEDKTPVVCHKGYVLTSTNSEMKDMGIEDEISAPTQSQATRWLRGKMLSCQVSYNVGKKDWYSHVVDMHEGYNLYSQFGHKTYEKALSEAITHAIKILNKNGAKAKMV